MEALRHSATVTAAFNLEGSMIESVERSLRAFGGIQTPYLHITGHSRRGMLLSGASTLLKAMSGRS
jgi:hypothetical protein